jgi:hypothetical protein
MTLFRKTRRESIKNFSVLPENLPPGMISEAEWLWFSEWAATGYAGKGEIVDLGCWLGRTTTALASGLAQNRRVKTKASRIYAYDMFRWEHGSERFVAGNGAAVRFEPGESCLGEFLNNIDSHNDLIEVCAGDLCKTGWNGKPIEFLLIDAMKSWRTANAVFNNFFPFLMPGRSMIAQQDFGHYFTSWIHLLQFRWKDFFEPLYNVPESGTMVYRYIREIPRELYGKEFSFSDFSDEEADEAFSYSMKAACISNHDAVRASHIMYYIHTGKPEKAMKLLGRYSIEGADMSHPEILDAVAGISKRKGN